MKESYFWLGVLLGLVGGLVIIGMCSPISKQMRQCVQSANSTSQCIVMAVPKP